MEATVLLPTEPASELQDQGGVRGACCGAATNMVWPGEDLNRGRCVTNRHRTYYNTTVTPYARTNTGVYVVLSEAAQSDIKAKWDGTPLAVKTAKSCTAKVCCKDGVIACTCGFWRGLTDSLLNTTLSVLFCCRPCRPCFQACLICDFSGCEGRSSDKFRLETIWYGTVDAPTQFSNPFWGCCCPCCVAVNGCLQPSYLLLPEHFKLIELTDIQPSDPSSQLPYSTLIASLVEVQPLISMDQTKLQKTAFSAGNYVGKKVGDQLGAMAKGALTGSLSMPSVSSLAGSVGNTMQMSDRHLDNAHLSIANALAVPTYGTMS